jgi:hypothetical protein
MYLQECVEARRVRTDQRWDTGVGARGEKQSRIARVWPLWRSFDVNKLDNAEPAERGQHDTNSEEDYRDGRSGRSRDGDPQDHTHVRRTM